MLTKKEMKILYIAFKYDYGDPQRGLSYEHCNFYDSLINNRRYQVLHFPFDKIMLEKGRDKMNKMLIETVSKEKPDICFFSLFTDEIKKETIREITNKSGTVTLNWFNDDHWRFDNYSKYWAPCFNWIVTTDSQAIQKYHKIGYKNVIKSQWACNHFLYKPLKLPKIYDVSFVGQPHSNRKKIIEKMKKAGVKIECWGRGWPNGKVPQEKMIRIFSQSKINLNLTKSSSGNTLKSIAKIFLKRKKHKSIQIGNPRYWIDNSKSLLGKKREQIKTRNFEIPGCKGFLVTGNADNLGDYYENDKEIIIYKNVNDLIERIGYYLKHDKERELIAQAGYERTLRNHTYEKRFNEIFNFIG